MPKELTSEEQVTKDQSEGIGDMIEALRIGPVPEKKKDEEKDKDKDKDKNKDKDKDTGEEDEDENDDDEEESNDDEDNDDEEEGDDSDSDDDEDEEDTDEEDTDDDDEDNDDTEDEEDDEEDEETDDEDDDLEMQLEILKAENAALKGKKGDEDDQQAAPFNIKDLKDIDFVDKIIGEDDDIEELASTKEGLNKLLNAVRTTTMQEMAVVLPSLAASLVKQRSTLEKSVDQFYEDNKDLAPHKEYVGMIAQQIQSKYPGVNNETLFKLTEKTVRKNLKLKKKVEKIDKKTDGKKKTIKRTDKSNPALDKKGAGGGGSRRKAKDTRTTEQTEMDKMIEATT